ncbi:MAG: Hsp20/alpha crystallin family protein [Anaerolineae bacterium]|nr:Hsp20/alpha crystallin family protein [Anaerolineae bacterium]MDQ7035192.1 Hsp20/alpha crystallin family protein [Anaerolineae bacterium]
MPEQKFDPMKELNKLSKTVGKVIEQGINTAQSTLQTAGIGTQHVRLDIYELNDEVVVITNSLDGLDKTSIEVSMEGDILTIKGETVAEATPTGASIYLQERKFGAFTRSVSIPVAVKPQEAGARVSKTGVLTVTLPVDKDRYQDITVTPTE